MPYDRFLIAPFETGLVTSLKPFMIPDDAFSLMENAYVWRGRVRKRFGSIYMGTGGDALTAPLLSRLRIRVGVLDGAGALAGAVPGVICKLGQQFSAGAVIFTVTDGTPGAHQMLRTDGGGAVATFDTATNLFDIRGVAHPAGTPVYFYPLESVMGITNYKYGDINNQPSFAFDTQFAYTFNNGWERSDDGAGNPVWHGTNSDFFWCHNWRSVIADYPAPAVTNTTLLFVTNFHANIGAVAATDDSMWAYNPNLVVAWRHFYPAFLPTNERVLTCRIITSFKDRLLLMNVIEQNAAHNYNYHIPNRIRYSHNGSPLDANAYTEINYAGYSGGGYIDAPTKEQIISIGYIKDRLIVYFERSTWELAFTGNQTIPFVFQKLNTELGSESTFSTVPFDKIAMTIGNTGIHSCNGANVERIDNKILDNVFRIRNTGNGIKRVAGIRDYFTEMIYWSYPRFNQEALSQFPASVLVYNYKNNSWGINDDCITAFGYFEQQTGTTWGDLTVTWEECDFPWSSPVTQANQRQVIAGNQQGFVFIITPDIPKNARAMVLNNVGPAGANLELEIIDHNLAVGDYIYIDNAVAVTGFNQIIYQVITLVDKDNITVIPDPAYGGELYRGGGQVSRVSNIRINSKQFNPYLNKGTNLSISKIDFAVDSSDYGQITVDYATSSSGLLLTEQAAATGCNLGNNILECSPYANVPYEQYQAMHWHSIYFQSEGEFIQLFMYLSDAQMKNRLIAFSDFVLEGMLLYTMPTSSRLE